MRASAHVLPALVAVMLAATLSAQSSPQARPTQADGVVRLLTELETALNANDFNDFVRLTADRLPASDLSALGSALFGEGQSSAAVRERDRRPAESGYSILAEILIDRGGVGRITTWQLLVQPRPNDVDRLEIAGASAVASIDGLVKLGLDVTSQYDARDLIIKSPGLTLHLKSGAVFLAHVASGGTALVFRGKGVMRFAPEDAAEQVQVRAFNGKPVLETPVEAVYLRLNPGDFSARVSRAQLVGVPLNASDAAKARALFDELSRKSYTLNLGDLTTEHWTLLPAVGDVLAELRTSRFGTLTYVRSSDEAEDISLFDRARVRNISVYASAERLAERGRYYNEDDRASYDVLHYGVDVRVDPEREWISGKGSLRVKTRRDGLSTLSLKLAESLDVSSVSSPTFGRLLTLRVAGQSSVLVSLPAPLPLGSEVTLSIYYSGRLPAQDIDREALLVSPDDQQGQLPSLEIPILPEPRYLYSNRTYWYPQPPTTDFATASLAVTVPAQFQVVGVGSLVSTTVSRDEDPESRRGEGRAERTVRFAAELPVRYLACIISRFVPVGMAQAVTPTGSVAVDVVATPRQLRSNRNLPERTADMLAYYAGIIGEAPYPEFSLAALDSELPSGHSPAYFAAWNQASLPTSLSWRDDPVSLNGHPFFFLAHEVAHQWWGQAIGWKNYHEQWLSEGLSQYFAARYAGHDRGRDTERDLFRQMRESALNLSRHGPVYLGYRLGHIQGDGRIFRGLLYNKSAVVLHMLQGLIGDAAFDRGVQRFYRAHRFRKAGTDDLLSAFQAETPLPLDRFFERWIHGFSLPEVRLSWKMADPTHVDVNVEQLGETFDFPLTVTIQRGDGRIELVTLAVTKPVLEALIPVDGPVRRLDARDNTSLVIVKRGGGP